MFDADYHNFFSGKTILIVDDDEAILPVLGILFREYGAVVIEAGSGKQAIDLLPDRNPDYIVTDYRMPNMDGLDLSVWVRKYFSKNIPIIILTGDVSDAIEYQVDDYTNVVYKPFLFRDIVESLIVNKKKTQRIKRMLTGLLYP